MAYLAELRTSWRPLLAAIVGVGSGMSIHGTITSAMAPGLIGDLGWSRSQFALIGGLGLVSSAALPFVGRLADTIGVRRTALIGQIVLPLSFLAYSVMTGSMPLYIAIFVLQSVIGMTTTSTVYSRLAVQNVSAARGLALAIVASGPAITGAIGGPLLNSFVEEHGWRAGYQAVAAFIAIAGVVSFCLIPKQDASAEARTSAPRRRAKEDYPLIFRSRAFWILLAAMLLCNLPQVVILTQLKLVLLDHGVSGTGASLMFGSLAIGMLVGRFVTGVALDRFDPYIVSFVTLGLPSAGLFVIASDVDTLMLLTFAVFCLGFAFGAEGDVVAYIVARRFGVAIYSSVMGLLTAGMSASAALGAALVSLTLKLTGGYDVFLISTGTAVIVGAMLLLLLGGRAGHIAPDPMAATA